jgi:hypothetical protein
MIQSILSLVKEFFNKYILTRSDSNHESLPLQIMGPATFQILSDLHLETHPSYDDFEFEVTATNLALLGDIGHIADDQLFTFLERQMDRYRTVFYLLGNHEPYHMSWKVAKSKVRAFETRMNKKYSKTSRFVFLDQARYDITNDVTVVGCTLFSNISSDQEYFVETRLVDFKKHILQWTVDNHVEAHKSDLRWLNWEISRISKDEPHRRIVIFTHYSPTLDPRSMDPQHQNSEVTSGFATDLSQETCWTSPPVVAWAFGHTHFSCCYEDENNDKKLVVSNQKGYKLLPQKAFDAERVFTFGEIM